MIVMMMDVMDTVKSQRWKETEGRAVGEERDKERERGRKKSERGDEQ